MTRQQIQEIQERIGTTPDGFWGPKSIKACQQYLRALMPTKNPWPRSDRASVEAFFGIPGDESNLVPFDFPFPTYYGGKRVLRGRCHAKVKDSLLRILIEIGSKYGEDRGIIEEAEDYGGIYNFRSKRGSASLSLHSWGIAIDLDADDNTFRDSWPMQSDMPLEIMECFAREGWLSAGAFWGYDAMHFQATR
jgi:hypothetical protein